MTPPITPVYPYCGYNFWSSRKSNLIFLDSARSAIFLIAKEYKSCIFILSAYTCPTVWRAIEQAGAKYDFVDIDNSLDFDIEDLSRLIDFYKNYCIAIVPTSIFGAKIRDYKLLYKDAVVIEDRAQGLIDEKSNADFQILSFGKGKMVSGFGGGAVLDRNHFFDNVILDLAPKNDFIQSYALSVIQKAASRLWFVIEGTRVDPENSRKLNIEEVMPSTLSKMKTNWILNTMASCDMTHRVKISDYYIKNISSQYLFDIQNNTPYLRFPIRKEIKFTGISKIRDFHETYHYAKSKRGCELTGAKKLIDGCFLPTHDLVSFEYAKKVVKIVNE